MHDSLAKATRPDDAVLVNGRSYAWPTRPAVVICFDGCDPAYIAAAKAKGCIPTIERMMSQGFFTEALSAMPSFTNPNNVSIVCGAPPAVHGVSGNFYLDRQTGETVMMTDAEPMRAGTIFAGFSQAGANVIAITAKDKLRKALASGMTGIAFSAEKADVCTQEEHGIDKVTELVGRPAPHSYSADLSLFVLDAGIKLLETRKPDILYLSLSDYVQHKHAPDAPDALDFMAEVDRRVERLLHLGAVVGIVADHGMNDMSRADGSPNVLYLGDWLDQAFGAGATRVICPITDPFVRHHGALGGFVRVHILDDGIDHAKLLAAIRALPEVEIALPRAEACARFELPEDREGDIAVIAHKGVALGARAADHDLKQLAGERLRSHGGLAEQKVPFLISHALNEDYARGANEMQLRNFDIFDFVLNGLRT
ncbi:phosphonoacetate hydrolase [Rhizobium sp. 007]|uniref:phosphonoacetate hydrolase n=1 Tax=Rhizobium sp. 007 TaxID=2785056 RepID=UPI00188FF781|nr:phosphonoacetate hydrolase [Rhizobium sp. 007]QPB24511.1 phosphonoacetate hydrolase [Rhizobium sp. 007]